MSRLIPGPLLSVLTGAKLEEMVCGSPHVSVAALKQISRYRDMDEHDQVIKWLWEVLSEFDDSQRVLFLKFVSGRSRLPGKLLSDSFDHIYKFYSKSNGPLPTIPNHESGQGSKLVAYRANLLLPAPFATVSIKRNPPRSTDLCNPALQSY